MMLDITSAPMTSACSWQPADTIWLAAVSAYVNAEQAALTSKPHALWAPILCCTRHAVLGNIMSGVTVPTTIKPMSAGVSPALSMAFNAASFARSEVATPGSTMCRSRIPVRCRIHSSVVSTSFSRSLFVSRRGGT